MLKQISIILCIALFTVTLAQAQDLPACDPYQPTAPPPLSITPADLSAPATGTDARVMRLIHVNPAVLNKVSDAIIEIDPPKADFADQNANLYPDEWANVTQQGDKLAVYDGVCASRSTVLAHLGAGSRVTVLDGPFASEGFAWWRIRRGSLTGWVIEGNGTEIWLQGADR